MIRYSASHRGSCTNPSISLMRFALGAFARAWRDGALDAVAGISGGLADIVVCLRMHNDRGAIAVEDRFLAIAERDGIADHRSVKRAVAGCIFVRQISRMGTVRCEEAMELGRFEAEIGTCRRERD